jgi:hypothetical protein
VGEGPVIQLVLLLIVLGRWPPHQQCHCCIRLAAVGHHIAQARLPVTKTKKVIKQAYKKMTAEEKKDLMQKLAELDMEDANDSESTPPSSTPV